MTPVEEVKSRLDIIDIISEYFPLKQAGANWRARCPFHDERTPSFMVSRAKQIWHCFGCGEGGDVISFVMKQEGLEFPDALRLLADKAGVRLKTEDPSLRSERQRLMSLLEAASVFWSEELWQQSGAVAAMRYLTEERRLKSETIRAWRLGYAPDSWEALMNYLSKLGYKEEEMIKSGVAIRKMEMRGRGAYDRFRHRLIFPIANTSGQIVGASGRTLSQNTTEAKYINTPETLIYRKGHILYGLDKAKTEIKRQNLTIVVEGNMDAVASYEAGVSNVVASSGTALTQEQVRLLKRYTDNLVFAFDADAAGESATLRGLVTALTEGCQVSLIQLPLDADGRRYKDPDECIRANPALWREAIAAAEPMLEHYFRRASTEHDLTKLADKQKVTKLLLSLISYIPDPVASSHYLKKLSDLVSVPERYLRENLSKTSSQPTASRGLPGSAAAASTGSGTSAKTRDSRAIQSERLLAAIIASPKNIGFVSGVITLDMLAPEYMGTYRAMIMFYAEKRESDKLDWQGQDFSDHLKRQTEDESAAPKLTVLTLLADKEFTGLEAREMEQEVLATVNRLKKLHLKSVLQRLENDIRTIEQSATPDKDRLAVLFDEFKTTSAELTKMDNHKNGLNRKL